MPITMDCNADELANTLFTSLTSDAPTPPTIDLTDAKFDFIKDETSPLYGALNDITIEDLTTTELDGDGVFDKLMDAVDAHIKREFQGNRITGDQYAKVYVEVMSGVLATSTQFLLSKDQAKWSAIEAQMKTRIAEIEATRAVIDLEKAKAEAAKMVFDMQTAGAQYALTKMQVANEDAKHCLIKAQAAGEEYKVDHLMPSELAISQFQLSDVLPSTVAINTIQANRVLPAEAAIKEFINSELQPIDKDIQAYNRDTTLPLKTAMDRYQLDRLMPMTLSQEQYRRDYMMPAETALVNEKYETERANTTETRSNGLTPIYGVISRQKEGLDLDNETKRFQIDNALPVQLDLIKEQREAERAKTLDTRSDSTIVAGSVGKQKDLYDEQIQSFIKDAKHKAAKMYLDGWITQKTLDEGLLAPSQLQNANVDDVLASLRATNQLT